MGRPLAILTLIAACQLLPASEAGSGDGLVDAVGDDGEAVIQAVLGLRKGSVQALSALPWQAYVRPLGLVDGTDPTLRRRWICLLPALIGKLPDQDRERALALLDHACRDCLRASAALPGRDGLAADFLPAPLATSLLLRDSANAVDTGAFTRALAIDAMLGASADHDALTSLRHRTALVLSGLAGEVDPAALLPPPGLPSPWPALPSALADAGPAGAHMDGNGSRPGLSITWQVRPRSLSACDPWGQVRWQRSVPRSGATVMTGPGGAAVLSAERSQCALVREDGITVDWTLTPSDARLLGIAAGAGWFAHGPSIHRLTLATGALTHWTLPAAPCSPPLVCGPTTLWLTGQELLLYHDDALLARIRHGLPVTEDWHLAQQDGMVLLCSGAHDGRRYRIEPLAHDLGAASASQAAVLLELAGRHEEVRAMDRAHAEIARDPAGAHALLMAYLAGGAPEHFSRAQDLCASDADRLTVVCARILSRARSHPGTPVPEALRRALSAQARLLPDLLLPRDDRRIADDPASWPQALSAAALAASLVTGQAEQARRWPDDCDDHYPLAISGEAVAPASANPRARAPTFSILPEADATTLSCMAADGALLWRTRWQAQPVRSAPDRSHAVAGGYLLLSEGTSRLILVDPGTGDRLGAIDLSAEDAEPSQIIPLGPVPQDGTLRIAMLSPPGIGNHIVLADTSHREALRDLGAPARWAVRAPGARVLVLLASGSALLIDGPSGPISHVSLPEAVRSASTTPLATAEGVRVLDRLYRWQVPGASQAVPAQ